MGNLLIKLFTRMKSKKSLKSKKIGYDINELGDVYVPVHIIDNSKS